MFNLKSLAIGAVADMVVRNAAGEPQTNEKGDALTITLYGPGTKEYQRAAHRRDERSNARTFARLQGKSEAKQSAEEKIEERAEFLAAVTKSFNGFEYGESLSGFEMFKAAYADIEVGHIADDAEKFLGERANFLHKRTPV